MALLNRKPQPVSEARTALADVLAEVQRLRERHRVAASADNWLSPAAEAVRAAQQAVDDARAGIEAARTEIAAHHHRLAMGEPSEEPPTVRAAHDRLTDAESALEDARAARDGALKIAADIARKIPLVELRLRDAALEVLRAETRAHADGLFVEVQKAQQVLADKGRALTWLAGQGVFPTIAEPGSNHGKPADPAIREALCCLTSPIETWPVSAATAGAAPWEVAFSALLTDAAAPLPVGDKG